MYTELKKVFEFDDPTVRAAILDNFNTLGFSSQLLERYNELSKKFDNLQALMEKLYDALKNETPPEGLEERRHLWLEMKKAIGF